MECTLFQFCLYIHAYGIPEMINAKELRFKQFVLCLTFFVANLGILIFF